MTVVVPVYNEADYLPTAVPRLFAQLAEVDADVSVLVVENGSTDDSAALVRSMMRDHDGLRLVQLPDANYGAAIRRGYDAALGRGDDAAVGRGEREHDLAGEWVVSFDIDYFSGPFLASALAEGHRADVVVASKRAPDSDDRRAPVRRLATWCFNALLRLLLGLRVSDTHGMKAVRRTVLDAVLADVVSVDDLFDTEVILRAERAGFRVVELPVVVQEERESRSGIWKRVPRTLRGIWRIRRSL